MATGRDDSLLQPFINNSANNDSDNPNTVLGFLRYARKPSTSQNGITDTDSEYNDIVYSNGITHHDEDDEKDVPAKNEEDEIFQNNVSPQHSPNHNATEHPIAIDLTTQVIDDAKTKTSEKEDELAEMICTYILMQVFDVNKTPQGLTKALTGMVAFWAALGACSTSEDFGSKFTEGLSKIFGFEDMSYTANRGAAWSIAFCNIPAQGSLTINSVWNVLTSLQNWVGRRSTRAPEVLKNIRPFSWKERAFLSIVPFSAFSSGRMVFKTLSTRYFAPDFVSGLLAGCSSFSSLAVNINFAYHRLIKCRGVESQRPIITILSDAKKKLKSLADSDDFIKFLQALQNKSLLKNLNKLPISKAKSSSYRYKKQMENIIHALLDVMITPVPNGNDGVRLENQEDQEPPQNSGCFTDVDWQQVIKVGACVTIAAIVSLANLEAGIEVPNLFGLTTAADLISFFQRFMPVSILSAMFAIPSEIINIIINGTALYNLINSVIDIKEEFKKGGVEYLKKLSPVERFIAGLLILTSLGYGAGKGGAALAYPAIKESVFSYINMVMSTVVFLGLGLLSQKGLFVYVLSAWYNPLLIQALEAENVVNFYKSLDPEPDKQLILRRLLINNIDMTLSKMILGFNEFLTDTIEDLFSPELQKRINAFVVKEEVTLQPTTTIVINDEKNATPENKESPQRKTSSPRQTTPPSARSHSFLANLTQSLSNSKPKKGDNATDAAFGPIPIASSKATTLVPPGSPLKTTHSARNLPALVLNEEGIPLSTSKNNIAATANSHRRLGGP